MRRKVCPYCGHKWKKRVKNPKACPRCKRRLDIERKTETED